MELVLKRKYFSDGTIGSLTIDETFVCYTIELPWRANQVKISCVPEGKYLLRKRYSKKYGWHIEVCDVPGRSFILLHPANNAQKELQGCIAPVSVLTSSSTGLYSRRAFKKVLSPVYNALEQKEEVHLLIL